MSINALSKPLMTRKQTLEYLHSLGFPMTETYFNKICLPSRNAGPPVAKFWGPRPLYDAEQVLVWAESRCRVVTQRVDPQRKASSEHCELRRAEDG